MKYILNKIRFKRALLERGFKNIAQFSRASGLHRNTLQNLLSEKTVFSRSFQEAADHLAVDPLELVIPCAEISAKIPHGDELGPLIAKVLQYDKNIAVVLFGSRARKKAKKYSDWDLGVARHPEPLSGRDTLRLKNIAEETSENLVRTVDIANLDQAPLWFLKNMGEAPIFLAGNERAFAYLKGVLDGIHREKAA